MLINYESIIKYSYLSFLNRSFQLFFLDKSVLKYRVSQKTWEFSDEFDIVFVWISIVIPNFKNHNIIMSARVYFMKTVNGCKDVSIMSPQDEQWRRTSLLCLYTAIFFTKYNRMQSKHKQTKCEHSRRNSYRLQLSQ